MFITLHQNHLTNVFTFTIDQVPVPSIATIVSTFDAYTVKVLSIGTDRSEQTVLTQIRLLLMEQSGLGLHCLPCHPDLFG